MAELPQAAVEIRCPFAGGVSHPAKWDYKSKKWVFPSPEAEAAYEAAHKAWLDYSASLMPADYAQQQALAWYGRDRDREEFNPFTGERVLSEGGR